MEETTTIPTGQEAATEPQAPTTPGQRVRAMIDAARANLDAEGRLQAPEGAVGDPAPEPEVDPDVIYGEDPEPVVEEEPELDPGLEQLPEGEEGEEGEPTADELTVEVERQPGQVRTLKFASKEDADLIRMLKRDGLRREEANRLVAKVERQQAELDYVEDRLRVDPTGFLLEYIPATTARELAMTLLLQDGVLDEEMVDAAQLYLSEPEKRQLARLQIQQALTERRQAVDQRLEYANEVRAARRVTNQVVDTLSEQFMDEERRSQFVDDMLRDVQEWAQRWEADGKRLKGMSAKDVLKITEQRLRIYGLDPKDAARALNPATATPPRARPKGAAAERVAAAAQKARETGERFKQGAARRQVAGKVGVTGAAASPVNPAVQPPANQNWKERAEWMKSARKAIR